MFMCNFSLVHCFLIPGLGGNIQVAYPCCSHNAMEVTFTLDFGHYFGIGEIQHGFIE